MAEITRSTDPKDYQSVPRAIAAMAKSFTTGDTIPPHAHARDQVLYATQGVMRVATEGDETERQFALGRFADCRMI